MLSKKFHINIIIRILFILFTCISIVPFILGDEKLFTLLSLFVLIAIQVFLLLKYINRFNREVSSFFSALKSNDASFAFHDKFFPDISEKLRNDITHIRNQLFSITESKEIQQSYFKNIIENAQTGILTIGETGKVDVVNKSALILLNISNITHIDKLQSIHRGFYQLLQESIDGTEKLVIINGKSKAMPLSVRISEFKQKKKKYKLVSFQNIQPEMEEKEVESWDKLIRVLTHEINNTISPISSLANSLEKSFTGKNKKIIRKEEISDQLIQKAYEGLHIISQRGNGLIDFVDNYRSIASLKKLNLIQFKVAELFYNLELLMKSYLAEKDIKLDIEIRPIDIELNADKKYVEQMCINLLKNSIEAIENKGGNIKLKAYLNERTVLEIKDNGKGIPTELIDQIYTPFFTTKKRGSGIGLSLARQIMQLHNGSISVKSTPNIETTFTLTF